MRLLPLVQHSTTATPLILGLALTLFQQLGFSHNHGCSFDFNVETINLTNAGTSVIDASGISGASEIVVLTNTTSTTVTGLAAGTAIGIGLNDTDGATAGLFDISLLILGLFDALTFNLNDTAGGSSNSVELKATGIETVTLTSIPPIQHLLTTRLMWTA